MQNQNRSKVRSQRLLLLARRSRNQAFLEVFRHLVGTLLTLLLLDLGLVLTLGILVLKTLATRGLLRKGIIFVAFSLFIGVGT